MENSELPIHAGAMSAIVRKTSSLAKASLILGIIGPVGALLVIQLIARGILPRIELELVPDYHVSVYYFMILLCVLLCPVSLVLGIMALRRIKKRADILKGKGLALSGVIINGIGSLLFFAFYAMLIFVILDRPHIENFNPDYYKGTMGRIILPYKGPSYLLVRDVLSGKLIRLSTTNGLLSAPTGTFELLNYTAIARDKLIFGSKFPQIFLTSSTNWGATSSWQSFTSITITSDSRLELDVGQPFTATILIKDVDQNEITLCSELTDRSGHPAQIADCVSGFQIITSSGNVVYKGRFQPGG